MGAFGNGSTHLRIHIKVNLRIYKAQYIPELNECYMVAVWLVLVTHDCFSSKFEIVPVNLRYSYCRSALTEFISSEKHSFKFPTPGLDLHLNEHTGSIDSTPTAFDGAGDASTEQQPVTSVSRSKGTTSDIPIPMQPEEGSTSPEVSQCPLV